MQRLSFLGRPFLCENGGIKVAVYFLKTEETQMDDCPGYVDQVLRNAG